MSDISGQVMVSVERTDGTSEDAIVDGSSFGLEDGGDWKRDSDDGELYAAFVFVANLDEFKCNLRLTLSVHGNAVINWQLDVCEKEFKGSDIRSVSVSENMLSCENLINH